MVTVSSFFFFFFFFFFSLLFFSAVNYRDMPSGRICQYSYKRINHLKVRLRRFQAVESENVPEKVYDIIKRDLLKRRIRWDGVAADAHPNKHNGHIKE